MSPVNFFYPQIYIDHRLLSKTLDANSIPHWPKGAVDCFVGQSYEVSFPPGTLSKQGIVEKKFPPTFIIHILVSFKSVGPGLWWCLGAPQNVRSPIIRVSYKTRLDVRRLIMSIETLHTSQALRLILHEVALDC